MLRTGLLVSVLLFFARQPQDPPALATLSITELSARCFGAREAAEAAGAELQHRVEADYPTVFAAWEQEQDARRRTCLEHALRLPAVRAAATIVSGTVQRIETIQGGVIDYHTLGVYLADATVLRAGDQHRDELASGYFDVLRGTSWDFWLAAQLRQNLEAEAQKGPRVWVLEAAESLRRERPGQSERHVQMHEWLSLPAAALPCLRKIVE